MIVLDTNVISDLISVRPSPIVQAWIEKAGAALLGTTVVSQAEILAGIAMMPEGHRRRALAASAGHVFRYGFKIPILSLDSAATEHFADIVATRQRLGRRIGSMDGLIAAIARANGAAVATRDVSGFANCGVVVHDPWAGI